MSDGITAKSNWRQKHGLGILGKNIPNSINEARHYNPNGPNIQEMQEMLLTGNTLEEVLSATDRWKDLDRTVAMSKIVEMTNSIDTMRQASIKLFGEDVSILKIEKIGSENFKKINTLLVEETIAKEDAALKELQAKIDEELSYRK